MTVYLVTQGTTIHGAWVDADAARADAARINDDRRPHPAFGGGRKHLPLARVRPLEVKDCAECAR